MNDNKAEAARFSAIRRAPRIAVDIPGWVVVRGETYAIKIQNISRFGALVVDVVPLAKGTELVLVIPTQGPRNLRLVATVVYWLDDAAARRHGKRAGIGLQFRERVDELDTAFSAAVTCELVEQKLRAAHHARLRKEKPTMPMRDELRAALVSAAAVPGSIGRLALAGDLETFALSDVLMALAHLRMSGRLDVKHDGHTTVIYLCEGDIGGVQTAADGASSGAQLFRSLSWRTGTFRMLSTPSPTSPPVRLKISQLLFDYARLQQRLSLPAIPAIPGGSR